MKTGQTADAVRNAVRETYGRIAATGARGCGCDCGGGAPAADLRDADGRDIPEGADMGLGSGNPLAAAALQEGETVLDLGSGGGVDCFLGARQVGEAGRVIGVDMTPEMVSKARAIAEQGGHANVEFRLGEIENLPLADSSVDVILSNCVVNLSPDKAAVYREAYRALRPGGRLAISDIVATAEFPEAVRSDLALHAACVAGAATVGDLRRILTKTGFEDIRIRSADGRHNRVRQWVPGSDIGDYLVSATIEAVKPGKAEPGLWRRKNL